MEDSTEKRAHGVRRWGVGAAGARDASGNHALDLTVATSSTGVVTVEVEEPKVVAPTARRRTVAACKDAEFNSGGHAWTAPLRWTFDARSTPRHLDRARALREIRAGAANIIGGRNDCGLARVSTVGSTYAGASTAGPAIAVSGNSISCGDYDTDNAVDFGRLPRGIYGWTCYWWNGSGEMVAADMRVSSSPALRPWSPRCPRGAAAASTCRPSPPTSGGTPSASAMWAPSAAT